jgi:hypothetical protein
MKLFTLGSFDWLHTDGICALPSLNSGESIWFSHLLRRSLTFHLAATHLISLLLLYHSFYHVTIALTLTLVTVARGLKKECSDTKGIWTVVGHFKQKGIKGCKETTDLTCCEGLFICCKCQCQYWRVSIIFRNRCYKLWQFNLSNRVGDDLRPSDAQVKETRKTITRAYTYHDTGGKVPSNVEGIWENKGKVNFCNFWNKK